MRIRILKHSAGVMQGVSLSRLLPGLIYEVPVALGVILIAQQMAEETTESDIGASPLPHEKSFSGGVKVSRKPH